MPICCLPVLTCDTHLSWITLCHVTKPHKAHLRENRIIFSEGYHHLLGISGAHFFLPRHIQFISLQSGAVAWKFPLPVQNDVIKIMQQSHGYKDSTSKPTRDWGFTEDSPEHSNNSLWSPSWKNASHSFHSCFVLHIIQKVTNRHGGRLFNSQSESVALPPVILTWRMGCLSHCGMTSEDIYPSSSWKSKSHWAWEPDCDPAAYISKHHKYLTFTATNIVVFVFCLQVKWEEKNSWVVVVIIYFHDRIPRLMDAVSIWSYFQQVTTGDAWSWSMHF